ncbi:MAG: 5-formyltetrahydrofolate cyclo-ligase [Gammaproteobacteria bacterium RIFCSPHIGHO2_12_FULL_41_20]|nr:MAG: 5-formyltetrahydrofolate cyclo-ligase [Gammaproteobacteria bacterium RIFCSPHIGHO2_12_FULL_41_20]
MHKRSFSILNKVQLRKQFRAQCRAILPALRSAAAQQAALLFSSHSFFKHNTIFASYAAREDEFDTMPLIKEIWQAGKRCYLPILSIKNDKHLEFAAYHAGDVLHYNRYHILEPGIRADTLDPTEIDIVILPLLAFDKLGNRLGTGAGYYDRTFTFLQGKEQANPLLIGLAYSWQQIDAIPADIWDIRLDGIITDQDITLFHNHRAMRWTDIDKNTGAT